MWKKMQILRSDEHCGLMGFFKYQDGSQPALHALFHLQHFQNEVVFCQTIHQFGLGFNDLSPAEKPSPGAWH